MLHADLAWRNRGIMLTYCFIVRACSIENGADACRGTPSLQGSSLAGCVSYSSTQNSKINYIKKHFFFTVFTLRYYACLCGHRELVEYLLQNGESVSSGYQQVSNQLCALASLQSNLHVTDSRLCTRLREPSVHIDKNYFFPREKRKTGCPANLLPYKYRKTLSGYKKVYFVFRPCLFYPAMPFLISKRWVFHAVTLARWVQDSHFKKPAIWIINLNLTIFAMWRSDNSLY